MTTTMAMMLTVMAMAIVVASMVSLPGILRAMREVQTWSPFWILTDKGRDRSEVDYAELRRGSVRSHPGGADASSEWAADFVVPQVFDAGTCAQLTSP